MDLTLLPRTSSNTITQVSRFLETLGVYLTKHTMYVSGRWSFDESSLARLVQWLSAVPTYVAASVWSEMTLDAHARNEAARQKEVMAFPVFCFYLPHRCTGTDSDAGGI